VTFWKRKIKLFPFETSRFGIERDDFKRNSILSQSIHKCLKEMANNKGNGGITHNGLCHQMELLHCILQLLTHQQPHNQRREKKRIWTRRIQRRIEILPTHISFNNMRMEIIPNRRELYFHYHLSHLMKAEI
jgi:hypothetical protein